MTATASSPQDSMQRMVSFRSFKLDDAPDREWSGRSGAGGVVEKAVNKFNFTEAHRPATLCLSAFAENAFGKIGAMKTITLSWITRAGAHCTEQIKPEELHARILALWRKRLRATAWWGEARDEECGWVWKLDGKWVWSCENRPERKETDAK